jgi:hypothetical protein
LPVQDCPAVQAPQAPFPSQTMPAPQPVPGDRLPKSRQTGVPVTQLVMPVLHGEGLPVQFAFAAHAAQLPEPLQTMPVPQLVPPGLFMSSAQVCTPVAHDVVPVLHGFGLAVHACPPAHAPQAPEPLQTMPTPQLVPAARFAPSIQVVVLPLQLVVPCLHAVGLPVQL